MSPNTTQERERERLERRIETLAGEIASLINTSESAERNDLRDLALSIVREEVRSGEDFSREERDRRSPQPFSPMAMAIPVFLMGAVMILLFPPVGLLLFVVAVTLVGWGMVMSLFSRRRVSSRG